MPAVQASAVGGKEFSYLRGLGTNNALPSNLTVVSFRIGCWCTGISVSEIGHVSGSAGDSGVMEDDEGMTRALSCMSGSYGWT